MNSQNPTPPPSDAIAPSWLARAIELAKAADNYPETRPQGLTQLLELRNHVLTYEEQSAREIAAQPGEGDLPHGYWLTLRSGVSSMNDNIVGWFHDNRTAFNVAELLMALDRMQSPEYSSYDVAKGSAPPHAADALDLRAHLQRQREWSERTFGPGARTEGVVDHIRKELHEILAAPWDFSEWIDVVILALDGAWRAGASPEQIIAGIVEKQTKNEGRTWPDWRTADPSKAIEHDRTGEA